MAQRPKSQKNKVELVRIVKEGPPQWRAQQKLRRSVRWGVVANQAETDFTINQLLYAQCVVVSATTCVSLAYAVRIRRVRIWFTSPTLATSISSTLEWNAGSTGFLMDGVSVAEVTNSTTEPACLDARPPVDSLASWFQSGPTGGTNVIFSFSAPAGAIIQCDYDWVPNFTEISYGTLSTTAGVLGTLGCRAVNSNILALPPLNSIAV